MTAIEYFALTVLGVFIISYTTAELLDMRKYRRKGRRK